MLIKSKAQGPEEIRPRDWGKVMVNVMERPKQELNTSWLNRPACFFEGDDADALPSMFLRPRPAATASKPRTINRRIGFSSYVTVLFLLAIAPLQAALLKSRTLANEERAIEHVLVVAKRGAELPSVPPAEAVISVQSQFVVWPSSPSFEDRQWFEAAGMFKLPLAEQNTSAMKQAENGRLPRRSDAWVTKTQKLAEVPGACAAASVNCWKTSIQKASHSRKKT
jgi:hypothetical protein